MRNDYSLAMIRSRSFVLFFAVAALALAGSALDAQRNVREREREQDEVRRSVLDQKVMPFQMIKRRTEDAMGGEATYVGASSPREGIYRMQFLRKDGKVIWVDVDGKTGDIIARTR